MRIESRPLAPLAVLVAISCGLAGAIAVAAQRFALGGALLLLAAILTRWPASIWSTERQPQPSPTRRRLALLAVCAIAVFFRVYRFEPPGLWGDDALNGLLAFDILDGRIHSPFALVIHSNSYFHALSDYPIAAAFWAFGPGPNTLRIPGVVANLLSVPLLYGAVAPLFGARVGLVAALFFACSPMQIAHAKSLTQIVLGEFVHLAGMCLLVRGVVGGRRWLIAAAGVPLALCLYTYHSTKIAPLVALPYLFAAWLASRPGRAAGAPEGARRPRPIRFGRWGLALLGVFLFCALPFIRSLIRSPEKIGGRISGTSIWNVAREQGWSALWDSLWRTLLIFHYQQGPKYHWFGLGFDPAFDCVVAFLAVPALVACLACWREPRHVFLLAWLALGLLPGILSIEAPCAYRVLLAAPPLYALAAWTLVRIDDFARGLPWRSRRIALRAAVVGLLVAVPVLDFDRYFFRTYTSPAYHYFQGERIAEMARTLRRQGPGWIGYVLADSFEASHECLRFLARCWGLEMRTVASLSDVLPVRGVDRGALFMMTRATLPASEALSAWYPEGRLEIRSEPEARDSPFDGWLHGTREVPSPSNGFFAVSRAMVDARRGARATFVSNEGVALPARIDPAPRLDGPAGLPAAPGGLRSARWSAVLFAESEGPHRFLLRANAAARLWVDRVEIGPRGTDGDVAGIADLASGAHLLEVEAALAGDPHLVLSWQPPARPLAEIPPALLFQPPGVGLLAERTVHGKRSRRYEVYPFSLFYAETQGAEEITWSGRLTSPAAGRRLRVEANAHAEVRLDGNVWRDNQVAPPGDHDFQLRLTGVPARSILRLDWRNQDGTLDAVPAAVFALPPSPGGGP